MRRSKRSALVILGATVATALALVIPTASAARGATTSAAPEQQQRDFIFITKNKHFDPAHGVRSGSGTASDPYVISGWNLSDLYIKDTNRYVNIVNNTITGHMVLDWIGDRVVVTDNTIGDLRVNQNVRRKGDMTSGLIADNEIGVVGQLRHWDGVFTRNTVGPSEDMFDAIPFFNRLAVNFDGFNGARFFDNVIYGFMDARLHGHHHSSSFSEEADSHYHGGREEHMDDTMDHSNRFHRVYIYDNTIHSDFEWALRYTDTAHSANDRTAASETNKMLNKPHVHHTQVFMTGNELIGSGLWVDVFNAKDERHLGTAPGTVVIRGNKIDLTDEDDDLEETFSYPVGISIWAAKDLTVHVAENRISGVREQSGTPVVGEWMDKSSTGIQLHDLNKAMVYITDNTLAHHAIGIQAARMTKSVYWFVSGLRTEDVGQDLYYDGSNVANPPKENP